MFLAKTITSKKKSKKNIRFPSVNSYQKDPGREEAIHIMPLTPVGTRVV
jgi:hypothetical protein